MGSLAQEATALLGAPSGVFATWTQADGGEAPQAADSESDAPADAEGPEPTEPSEAAERDHPAREDHECTCRSCPLCRVVAAARTVSPEVRTHLVAAGASLVAAFAGLMETAAPATDTPHDPHAQSSGQRGGTASPRVARITVEPEDLASGL